MGAVDQGLIFAIMALGVFLTFRILNFADLTVDGSFTAGTATTGVLIVNGMPPLVATLGGVAAGALAGMLTGTLHTKFHIDPLLASILVMLSMYTINLRIMSFAHEGNLVPNVLLGDEPTLFSGLFDRPDGSLRGTWVSVAVIGAGVLIIAALVVWFLNTKFGFGIMTTGDNPGMASAMGISTNMTKIVTLMVSNGLVGLCGAIWFQYTSYSSIEDGRGMILIGLASVILGNAIFGTRFLWLAAFGVVVGAVLYRLAINWALNIEAPSWWPEGTPFIENADVKLMSAVLVVLALVISQSKSAHALVTKLSPWRRRSDVPEQMSVVPNPFSPMAEVDAAHEASTLTPSASKTHKAGQAAGPPRGEGGTKTALAPEPRSPREGETGPTEEGGER